MKVDYLEILKEELVVAQGCTEPIAGAYTAAIARDILNEEIEKIEIIASKNIIKNAKGVVIPNSDKMTGIESSVVLGAFGGDSAKEMEVLANITQDDIEKTKLFIANKQYQLELADTPAKLFLKVTLFGNGHSASATIVHTHMNIVQTTYDEEIIINKKYNPYAFNQPLTDRTGMTMEGIFQFINEIDSNKLSIIKEQIRLNTAISEEGLANNYGINVAQSECKAINNENLINDVRRRATQAAAAGSDARMSGCVLPVMTLNGSGNQGMTASLPVIEFAKEAQSSPEKLLKAVAFADLTTIRLKHDVGRLSPLCGATVAAIGACAGVMYLLDADLKMINMMITNTIANDMGVICDGAKPSCALKIHSGIKAAFIGADLAYAGNVLAQNTGIIGADIEETIENLGKIAKAMSPIDDAIINVMMKEHQK